MKYDCHSHVFNYEHVPDNFFGCRLSLSDEFLKWAQKMLSDTLPSDEDVLENIADFLKHQELSLEENATYIHKTLGDTYCNVFLCVDLSSVKGKKDKDIKYIEQVEKTLALKTLFPCKVFVHIDPNQPYFESLVTRLENQEFDGLKIYPSLDNDIHSASMDKVFAICANQNIPVTAHCNPQGVAAGSFFNILKHRQNNPIHWKPILAKYPNLKLNLAHFAGVNMTWKKTIVELMNSYPNVYTDTSYTCGVDILMRTYSYMLKKHPILKERILFGTDFYMTSLFDKNYLRQIERVKKYLGEIWENISEINPKKFLEP